MESEEAAFSHRLRDARAASVAFGDLVMASVAAP